MSVHKPDLEGKCFIRVAQLLATYHKPRVHRVNSILSDVAVVYLEILLVVISWSSVDLKEGVVIRTKHTGSGRGQPDCI